MKRWTRFESNTFKNRFEKDEVICVCLRELALTVWDKSRDCSGFDYHPADPLDPQAQQLALQIAARVEADALEGSLQAE